MCAHSWKYQVEHSKRNSIFLYAHVNCSLVINIAWTSQYLYVSCFYHLHCKISMQNSNCYRLLNRGRWPQLAHQRSLLEHTIPRGMFLNSRLQRFQQNTLNTTHRNIIILLYCSWTLFKPENLHTVDIQGIWAADQTVYQLFFSPLTQ